MKKTAPVVLPQVYYGSTKEMATRVRMLELAIAKYRDHHSTRNMFAMFDLVEEV